MTCGSGLLLSLPEDVLELISFHLRPRDLCSLALCCRSLRSCISASDKAWIAQCRRIGPPPALLARWRAAVRSYRALCRFLAAVAPLLGVWVHMNSELGNVVCVEWGFVSVVACRVIPQELGPLGLESGPLVFAPVFEIVGGDDGAPSRFFLHGRDHDEDSVYPGSLGPVDPFSNVLLLEVDVRSGFQPCNPKPQQLLHSASLTRVPASGFSRADDVSTPKPYPLPFGQLAFRDRRKLLDLAVSRVRIELPTHLTTSPLLPPPFPDDDCASQLAERRSSLIRMHDGHIDWGPTESHSSTIISESDDCASQLAHVDWGPTESHSSTIISESGGDQRKRSFFSVAGNFRDRLRQLIRRTSSESVAGLISRNATSLATGESKHTPLREFLGTGNMVGLCLRAANMKLSPYRAWPNMHDNRFALYKLPFQDLTPGMEFAGLWGGTFGWPPGRPSENKPGKALFFLLLSYEEVDGHPHLIGTKILEGTHYVLHPNGSAMFSVKVDEDSSEPFPWEFDGDSLRVEVTHSYDGVGISSRFRSKPGSLFVMQNGVLAFVWKESKAVLTLQRLDLQELLRKGERVPALPPIANFTYLTKSYPNVFLGYSSNFSSSICSSLPFF